MQRERVFRILVGVAMGASAAAAVIAGFRETPTEGQVICLLLAATLAGAGSYLVAEKPSKKRRRDLPSQEKARSLVETCRGILQWILVPAGSLEKKARRRHSLLGANEANGAHLRDSSPGCMHPLVRIRTSP